jgi:signal transduction histidine kinase
VLKASRRAKTLVHQILAFSRPTQQQREPILLQPIVEEVVTFLRVSLPKDIEVRSSVDASVSPIAINLSQVQQVLTNLCANATQALRDQGGRVEVDLRQVKVDYNRACTQGNLKPGSYIRLTVQAIVHGIVTGHGGAISVDSAPGEGTMFRIYLPVTDNGTPSGGVPSPPPAAGGGDLKNEGETQSYVTPSDH